MTTMLDASAVLLGRFAEAFPTVPTWFPGTDFMPPSTGTLWCQVRLVWGAGEVLTMAPDKTNRVHGVLQVRIYAPQNTGDGDALRLAEQVRQLYNRLDEGGVRCEVASGFQQADDYALSWFAGQVTVPYWILETAPGFS